MSRLEEEYREFVGSRAASLHRTAYLLCGDWHLADDLVQETFVQTFRHWRRVQRAGNQNAYVKRILINEFKRHWQRYSGLPVRADLDRLEFAVPNVSNEVVNRADLLGALLTLPARQRATVVLRYLEGMSERETAAVLRCSEGGAPPAPRTAGAPPARTGAPTSPAGSAATRQPLVKLAADLVTEASPAGDATLVERETGAPGKASTNVWDLYTDDGRYFLSPTEAGLPPQVSRDNNQGDGQFGREVAAAAYAAAGDLGTAALKMACPYATPVPAWLSAQVKNRPAGGLQIDDYVWEDCEDALVAGSGQPQVRAGVLRLVSALPGISVTHGTADGQF